MITMESCLRWIMTASSYFTNILKLAKYTHTIINKNIIPRSSYKFCFHNYECKYNYNSKCKGCYAQHFPHNMVYADIYALINHILKFNLVKLTEIKKLNY